MRILTDKGLPQLIQLIKRNFAPISDISFPTTNKSTIGAIKEIYNTKYQKPVTGIPETDLDNGVKAKLALATTALQEGDNVSRLTNDAGYIDKDVDNLTNYYDKSNIDSQMAVKEDAFNKVTTLSPASSDTQYPSAKVVFDTCEDIRAIAAGKNANFSLHLEDNPAFDTQDMQLIVSSFKDVYNRTITAADVNVGDNAYVTNTSVPDRWVVSRNIVSNEIVLYILETAKCPVQDVQDNGTSVVTNGIANISGKQNMINSSNKLNSDFVDDTNHNNKFVTTSEKNTWNAKEDASNKVTSISATSTNTQYPSALATYNAVNTKSTVSVSAEGTSTNKVTYITIDGTEYKMADEPTEQTVTLAEDLYTYVNIGKITGASQTNPVQVAYQGDPLKNVFNAILGTEVDVNPTINQGGTTFTKSGQTGTTSAGGGEVGLAISAQTGTVTFTVTNTATCTYGLKAGTYDTYSKTTATTFNYPIKQRTIGSSTYELKIAYPALNGCTITVTAGTLVQNDTTNRILYCNTNSDKKVTISIAMPAKNSTTGAQTRFDQLTADVSFDSATYNGVAVDNFWTYLKAAYNDGKTHTDITNVKSTAYTITAGSYYTYYKVTNDTTASSTGWTPVGSTSIADIVVVANAGQYIWFASTQNKTAIYEWNDVSGKYNTDATATIKASNQTIHTTTGQDVASYYTYRTTSARSGATNKKFKLA